MKKTVLTLEEAFRDGLVKVGDYIDYQPIYVKCTFKEKDTGFEKNQTFSTEKLKWRLDEFEGKLILIAATATEQLLTLKGNREYDEYGEKTQNKLCKKLYSNPSISSEVVSTSKEIQEQLKECNLIKMSYWLPSRRVRYLINSASRGVHGLGGMGCSVKFRSLFNSIGYVRRQAVRPVVFLKSDIQINLEQGDGSKENPWEICGVNGIETEEKEKSSDSKVELMQLIQEAEKAIEEGNESINKVKELLERAKKLLEKM